MDHRHLNRLLEVDPHLGWGLLRGEYLASQEEKKEKRVGSQPKSRP
jgi:hypothetical protein